MDADSYSHLLCPVHKPDEETAHQIKSKQTEYTHLWRRKSPSTRIVILHF